ncbi:MAG TPA: FAD-dependent oxidoreductase [Streptosporangiaceae bacterium]|nr:FAD-dependent oxidoreductase [Streptosporangiaceae bacterium]
MTDDVVVAGSGAAALTAALSAAVRGAQVTVLERTSLFGGTSAISGGGMWLPANGLDPDFPDSVDDARRYVRHLTLGLVDDRVIDRYLNEAAGIPGFLSTHTALSFWTQIGRPDYHADFDGASGTSRTVFPDTFDTALLGEAKDSLRRPHWPGGIPPLRHDELQQFIAAGDPDGWKRLVEERMARGIVLRGCALVGGLLEACQRLGVRLLAQTRARELMLGSGRVTGVRAERDGVVEDFPARQGVVLASGGFEWNRQLWDALLQIPWDGPASPPNNEGDALIMASRAGARLANLNRAWFTPARDLGETYEGRPLIRIGMYGSAPGEILVNRQGRRFVNEALNYNDIGIVMTAMDPSTYEFANHPTFAITDRRYKEKIAAFDAQTLSGDRRTPEGIVEAPTLRELAGKLGIDPDGLQAQVEEFNKYAADGSDPVFHRGETGWERHIVPRSDLPNPSIAPILDAPFIGYNVRAGVFGTKGGPVINENAQIVGMDGTPIPGLCGAGNAVASIFGAAYPGGGATLGPGVTFGYVAGLTLTS